MVHLISPRKSGDLLYKYYKSFLIIVCLLKAQRLLWRHSLCSIFFRGTVCPATGIFQGPSISLYIIPIHTVRIFS